MVAHTAQCPLVIAPYGPNEDMAMSKKAIPIHPGEHLAEYLDELEITPYRLAKDIHVPQTRISEILKGTRGITADTALRLSRYFGTTVQFWLNLQVHYETEVALDSMGNELDAIVPRAA
jgi:addiction module HigA family antidote